MGASFLPTLSPLLSHLTVFGLLLFVGVLGGELARRFARLPRITGYVLAGVLLGPDVAGVLDRGALFDLRLLVDFCTGLVLFELGRRLDFEWLRRNHWLFVGAIAECVACYWAIYAGLSYLDFAPVLAGVAAAIGTASSPAVVLMISHELRSEGQITQRLILFSTVNTVFAYAVLTLLLPLLHLEQQADWSTALLHPIYTFGGAASAGYGGALLLIHMARWLGKSPEVQLALLVSVVIAVIGVAHSLNLSVAVALLTLGMMSKNLDRMHVLTPVPFGYGSQIFFLVLFVLTGASLEFHAIGVAAAVVAAVYVIARFLGKALALLVFGAASGIPRGGAGLLALALVPMSEVAVVMVRDTVVLYPSFGRDLAAVVLSAVVMLNVIGPVAAQFALRHAGEAHPNG
jgi:Kef-type K+ transport system membrane component KefB